MAVAYFYFDFVHDGKQTHEHLLHSLIIQISTQTNPFPQGLKRLYKTKLQGSYPASYTEILKEFDTLLLNGDFGVTYIMTDALDECINIEKALELIDHLRLLKLSNLRLLVTSRREQNIEEYLTEEKEDLTMAPISLRGQNVEREIQTYISYQLSNKKPFNLWPKEILAKVQQVLTAQANGM